jgi:DNA-3-methyladenine glycosylase
VSPRRLPRSFFGRPATEVAPDLLGHVLVRRLSNGAVARARLVELEAYEPDDPGSHAFRGMTLRNEVMFGSPGHLYVYFTYGMHFCMNAVTRRPGEGSAVLLRAGEPLEGLDEMRSRRGRERDIDLCSGPGRFTQALGIARPENGVDLVGGESVWVERGSRPETMVTGIRVGVHDTSRSWRFWLEGSPFVSRGRPGPPTPKARRARTSTP